MAEHSLQKEITDAFYILVIGGAGYIGSHTVRHLLDRGYRVVVADNLICGYREAVDTRAAFEHADLLNPVSLEQVFEKYSISAVVHFAAFAYIEVCLNTDFKVIREEITYDWLFYTGPIDEFFDYKYGHLPYRSLNLVFWNLLCEYAQSGPQINYPCNHDYTRSVEYKYYLDEKTPHTTVSHEYPCNYAPGKNELYYPIPSDETTALYKRYAALAHTLSNVSFLGRLGTYRYLNMDQVAENAPAMTST